MYFDESSRFKWNEVHALNERFRREREERDKEND